jgi:prepilin-type processing-associated H-X9-DG protein
MLGKELATNPRILFCPDADQPSIADQQLGRVGIGQAQSDYYYRHASGSNLLVDPPTTHLQLARLGRNSQGRQIRALALDVNFLATPGLSLFGGFQRTCHNRETVNVLYSDGHVSTLDNRKNEFTVDGRTNIHLSFAKILAVFEAADKY